MGRQRAERSAVTTTGLGTVYALIDPRDNCVRYIGATTKALKVRLNGHLVSKARRVKAWVDELAVDGLTPRIEPIREAVPEDDLGDLERAEITRRLIAGERLLNEAATAPARRHIERQRELDRIERDRAAWEHVANQVRLAVGGPLAPGNVPPIPLDSRTVGDYHALMRAEDEGEVEVEPDVNRRLSRATRLTLAREKAEGVLWRAVRPMWGELRGGAGDQFDGVLSRRVGSALRKRWVDLRDAPQYLALLPWSIVAVGPWAALAERAGMDISGGEFIDWVTDDATVREALTVLLVRSGDRMGPLSALDRYDNFSRPSTGLVAMTAAHLPGFDLPRELNSEIKTFLEWMLRYGQLTPAMADLLLKLDPSALNKLLGREITAEIDARLGLPPGASKDVLMAVLERLERSHGRDLDRLVRVVNRAQGAFPTVDAPDFRSWRGDTVPMFQAIIGSLTTAGVLAATPRGKTPADLVSELRALWSADISWLERTA